MNASIFRVNVTYLSTTVSKADIANKYVLSSNIYGERSSTITLVMIIIINIIFIIAILPDRSPCLPLLQRTSWLQLSEIIEKYKER